MILWATHLKSLASVHFELEPGFYSLGRRTKDDPDDKLSISFDSKLSRRTARIEVKATRLVIKRDGSKAPLFVDGLEKEQFELIPGQRFSVAETVFELAHVLGQTMTADELDHSPSHQADKVLSLMLQIQPLFSEDLGPEELGERLNRALSLSNIGLFQAHPLAGLGETQLRPSKSLVAQACLEQEPVYFEWANTGGAGQPTAAQGESWALAAPIFTEDENWLLYAVGHQTIHSFERGGICLLAQMLKSHLEARRMGDLTLAKKALDLLKTDLDPNVRRATEQALRAEDERVVLRLFSMGTLEAHCRGERLDKQWSGKQSSWLLSYLASSARPHLEDRMLNDFWPDKGSPAKKTLTVAISRLRKHLQQYTEQDPISRDSAGYTLGASLPYWHDFLELQEILDWLEPSRLQELPSEKVIESGQRLLKLYRGPYLEGCYFDWAVERRANLELRMQTTLTAVANFALEHGFVQDALAFGLKSLEFDPCSQSAHLSVMNAFLDSGQPEQAVRQYEICQKTLSQELQLEPSIELFKAFQKARLES